MKIKCRRTLFSMLSVLGITLLVGGCILASNTNNLPNYVQTSSENNLTVACDNGLIKSATESTTKVVESTIPPLDYEKTLIICCGIIGGLLLLLIIVVIIKYSIIKKRRKIQRQKIRRQVFNDYITLTD